MTNLSLIRNKNHVKATCQNQSNSEKLKIRKKICIFSTETRIVMRIYFTLLDFPNFWRNADRKKMWPNLCRITSRAGKIRFSGARKSMFLKASSGERCAPRNFVHLVTLQDTRVRLIVYLVVHQMKYVMERWSNAVIFCNFLT